MRGKGRKWERIVRESRRVGSGSLEEGRKRWRWEGRARQVRG